MDEERLRSNVIGAAIEVHRYLGPGLLESAYEECLCWELNHRGIEFKRQLEIPIRYKGQLIDCAYKLDLLIENLLVVELKSVEALQPIHEAQVITYLNIANLRTGLLINFNVQLLKHGLRRLTRKAQNLPALPDSL